MKKLFNMDAKKRNIIVASILGVTIGGLSMFGLNHKNKELVQKEKIAEDINIEKEETNVVNNVNNAKTTTTQPNTVSRNKETATQSSNSSTTKETTTQVTISNNNNNNKENTKPSASSNDDSYSNVDWDKVGEVFENSNWTQIGSGYIDGPNGNTWEKYEGAYDGDIKSENIYGK